MGFCRRLIGATAAVLISLSSFSAYALKAVDVAGRSGFLPARTSDGKSVVFDYDRDGDADILLSGHALEWPLLRQGPPGRFTQVQRGTFVRGDRHGCAAADFNGDRRPDLYCTVGACRGICTANRPKELYLQRPNQTFQKIAGAWGASDPHGRGRDVITLDFDRDGDPDLFVANEKSTAFPNVGNHLYRNLGGRFVEVRGTPLAHTTGTVRAVAIEKPNGYPDVVLATVGGVFYYSNNRGRFASGRRIGGRALGVEAADLNGDRRPDLVIMRRGSIEVRLNEGGYRFARSSYRRKLTMGRSVALCQLDGRAGIDLYVVQGTRPTHQDLILLNPGNGRAFNLLATPRINRGHGDVATCLPGYPGALGDAVVVTNNRLLHPSGNPGPTRLMIVVR